MNQKKRKNVWQSLPVKAGFLAAGGVCGFAAGWYLMETGKGKSLSERLFILAFLILALYLSVLIQVVIHEAGHMAAGMLTGYRFCSFRIFSFMWIKEHGKLEFRRFSLAGTGGQCLMAPPDFKNGTIPVMLYNFGGPVMNAAAGMAATAFYFVCEKGSFPALAAQIFALTGFMFAALNGIPMHMGMVDNDGYNALSLSRSRKAQNAFWMQMKVNSLITDGVRLKDMPDEWFTVPSDEDMKNSMVAVQGVLAAGRLMDGMRFDEADQLMERLLKIDSGIVSLHRHLMICDRMYVELTGQNRQEVLEGMMTRDQVRLMKTMKNYLPILRTAYTYALLGQKDTAKAEQIRTLFEKNAAVYPYPVEAGSERELIALAENIYNKSCKM